MRLVEFYAVVLGFFHIFFFECVLLNIYIYIYTKLCGWENDYNIATVNVCAAIAVGIWNAIFKLKSLQQSFWLSSLSHDDDIMSTKTDSFCG